jgi:hypothetical protein
MPDCARCGTALECRRRQPATQGDGETEHYRCPGCGEGGFRVLGPNGSEQRTGGPAFDGLPDRRATVQDADDGILIADGGHPPDHKPEARAMLELAEALERVADAQERQAVAAEVHAGAVAEIAHDKMTGRNSVESALDEWAMWLEVYRRQTGL